MKHFLAIIFVIAFAQLQAQYSVSIIFENNNTFESTKYQNLGSHEFLRKKDTDEMSSMNVKYKGTKKWDRISVKGAWGYIINEGSQKEKTYRFINGKEFKLIEGNKEGNAIYNSHFQMYLILLFIWKDTYYLSYKEQLIELKSKKHLAQIFEGSCFDERIAANKNRWVSWWITKTKKLEGKSRLMSMIETCNDTSLQDK